MNTATKLANAALVAFAFSTSAVAFADACLPPNLPVPDSEEARIARDAFSEDSVVRAAASLLIRNGFCAFETGPDLELTAKDCEADGACRHRFSVMQYYEHLNSQQTWTEANVEVDVAADGSHGRPFVFVSDLGVGVVSEQRSPNGEQSEVIFAALEVAGVPKDPYAISRASYLADRVDCFKGTALNAPTTCEFTLAGQTYPVEDTLALVALHAALGDLGATIDTGADSGFEHTGGAIVECFKHDEGGPARCGLWVEL